MRCQILESGNETADGVGEMVLDAMSRQAFELLLERINSNRPRRILADVPDKPILIFTDGAVEPASDDKVSATVGGVIFKGEDVKVFGTEVHPEVVSDWLGEHVHLVGLTELYAVVTALKEWADEIYGRRVILFCDNWTAIDDFVKGSYNLRLWKKLLLELEKIDAGLECMTWMARVPSPSNVADPPSRGSWSEIEFLQPYTLCKPKCPITGKALKQLSG